MCKKGMAKLFDETNKKGVVELLVDKTNKKFDTNCVMLSSSSHEKVCVRCFRCGEEFLREFRNLNQLHTCPTHIIRDGVKFKWCNICLQFLPYVSFSADDDKYDNLSLCCVRCESHHKAWIQSIISKKQLSCLKNNINFNIDYKYFKNQYDKQNGKCFYTNILLEFGTKELRSASLKRINPVLGYTTDNVVLVCEAIQLKNSNNLIKFILERCKVLSSSKDSYVRVENKIIHSDGQLPFRKRTSDAGYDVHSVECVVIAPHSVVAVDVGIIASPPENAYYTIEGRSSVFAVGVTPYRGIIDGTYQGPLKVMLVNNSHEAYEVKKGDRIAQLVLHKIVNADFVLVDEFTPIQNGRAGDGWGSSGK